MRILKPEPLSATQFSAFGDVIGFEGNILPEVINYGTTKKFNDLAHIDVQEENGDPTTHLYRSNPIGEQLELELMENHPLSSQLFYPLSGRPYLVVVAPPGRLETSQLRCFLAGSNQGVNYRRGVWHHYCLALHEVSDFLVIDRAGPGENCVEAPLDPPVRIDTDRLTLSP